MFSSWPRTILHLDMDAFYASIEQRDRPELRGRPVLIASDRPRSVVSTASYEARPFGCRSAQPVAVAKRLCPHAILVTPRMERYGEVSGQVFALLEELSPLVEPLSIDEAFVDLTGTERLLGPAPVVAERLRARIKSELGLTASCGIAPNKFLAKLGSDLDKPDGLTIVGPDDCARILAPLPVGRVWGVGPKAAERLAKLGVRTIGELLAADGKLLEGAFGSSAQHWRDLASGIDDRAVVPDTDAKSIGQERTFETDLESPEHVRSVLLAETEAVARRVRRNGLAAREVHVKIRYGDFETITRQTTLPAHSDATSDLWSAASALFDAWAGASFRPVRLIGVSVGRLGRGVRQEALFDGAARARSRRLDAAADRIRDRFGDDAVRRAGGRVEEELSPSDHRPRENGPRAD